MALGWRVAFSALWLLLVCYPDPRVLWRSIQYTARPPVDPDAVRPWASLLPDDPAQVESAVHTRLRYGIPWQTDGVPWKIPSPAEALAAGYGDCQARAVVLASVLAAKGIPFQLRASLDHMWVDYPGKRANALENDAKLLWARREAAGFRFRLPQVDWAESYRIEKEYFWDAAPRPRKLALFVGLAIIWLTLLAPRPHRSPGRRRSWGRVRSEHDSAAAPPA